MFDDRYYNKIIKKYKYNPMDFKPMNFYFNNISPNIMKTKWLCHSGIDKINNYSSTIISTGIGLSGVPHMGTLSQIMRSIFLQSKGFKVQFVLGDLDSYNARNQELNIVLKRAEHYKKFFSDEYKIIGFDYKSEFPWDAKIEFSKFFDSIVSEYDDIYLIANSLGAYYSMLALSDKKIKKAMFISPVVDMEKEILNMMKMSNVSEEELYNKKEIATSFGETLSWEYLTYVRNNPIEWNVPTDILYAENDFLTSLETMTNFANKTNSSLTIMKNGEHYFHTEEQMNFLDNWFSEFI